LISHQFCLGRSTWSWWPHDENSWRSSWCIVFESQHEHLLKFSSYIGWCLIFCSMFKDELIENFFNSFHIKFIFFICLRSEVFQFITIERLVNLNQIVLHSCDGSTVFHSQQDKFVWQNSHSLKREGLNFRSWETLKNPALLFSFGFLNLFCY